ncbi:hypothetical protein [Chryseobacterium sp. CCH4-E10]|uniref:hypothetical protein n=1 Tax=Chryseobacterium sp. CCH4-E10 TaxID=1768758 RepID=UPI0008303A77|nr:hypothetical protein [Chryseobacterium sp. CCH4-E10]
MKKNEITTKEKLKTYFKKGKYPTESQFAELIDSLKLEDEVLTNKELVNFSNMQASLNNGSIIYTNSASEDSEFSIVVSSEEDEEQILTLSNTNREKKLYFYGSSPYRIRPKNFTAKGLEAYEYYCFYSRIDNAYAVNRLFGNNLPSISETLELGTVNNDYYIQIYKLNFEQEIHNLHTTFTFVNKTIIPIQYAVYGDYWCNPFTAQNMITDHYNVSDYLNCYYKADFNEFDGSIECKIFNADNNDLIQAVYLTSEQQNQDVWGGTIIGSRNVRIECDYVE